MKRRRLAAGLSQEALAEAAGLNMAAWWQPTRETYLGRVTKVRVLESVTEGVGARAAEKLASLKREPLARAAEKRRLIRVVGVMGHLGCADRPGDPGRRGGGAGLWGGLRRILRGSYAYGSGWGDSGAPGALVRGCS